MRQAGADPRDAQPGSRRDLVVVGASVRAIAASAARTGWSVHAADLFTDVDLRRLAASAVRVTGSGPRGYPRGLPAAAASFPPGPWLYTGALENHPDTIDEIAAIRPLAGNDGATLRAVRDHARLAASVRAAGLCYPPTVDDPAAAPTDGSFLVKPVASAGGRGIRRWRGRGTRGASGALVWQRFVPGTPWSAACLADPDGGRLFAASRQFTGLAWCGAGRFAYCGSLDVALDDVPDSLRRQFERAARAIAADFGLVGLFGIDMVVDPRGRVHVIEVNPRPTASMELCERATGIPLAATHLAACGFPSPTRGSVVTTVRDGAWSKAVVFATQRVRSVAPPAASVAAITAAWTEADGAAALADLPRGGVELPAGGPIVTVFAHGDTPARSLATLRTRVAAIRRLYAAAVSRPFAGAPRCRRRRARTA
jgi:uncharacterized protein